MNGRAAVTVAGTTGMEIREYPVPEPGPEEMLVKITMAGICGSDLHMWRGEVPWFQAAPGLQGHEMTGTIARLGADRQTDSLGRPLHEGDRVAYAYFIPCGECWACMSGTTGCPNRYRTRNTITAEDAPHFLGAYAEYYVIKSGQWVFKVPEELPDELVAPVNCALAQVVYGLNQIGIWLSDTVVIQGAGALGLYACALAKDMGAARVIAIDGVSERLSLAGRFGADQTISLADFPSASDRIAHVLELTSGVGADVCVEVAGVAGVVQEGLEMLRVGGRYLWMGNIVPGAHADIVPHDAVRRPKQIKGVLAYDRWVIPRALDWLVRARDRYPFEELVGSRYPLDKINDAFAEAEWSAGRGSVARIALIP
ncbi:MAG TPA: zinc-binding dehydrogenase [Chloroflexota bacterium]|jgi:threonine dehydrogenase-like Zn-dependent dehydrogenase|nr:zinc-binding dehydrogenase [Chloroflexota bacterium]